jgi:hypothetical protein
MNVTRTVLLGLLPFAALIFFNIKIYMRFLVTRGRYARPNSHNSSQVSGAEQGCLIFLSPNIPNRKNIYQMTTNCTINYTLWPQNIPNGHKILQHFTLQVLPKIGIFGLKANLLATLEQTFNNCFWRQQKS